MACSGASWRFMWRGAAAAWRAVRGQTGLSKWGARGARRRRLMGSTRRGARAEDSNPNPNYWRPDKQRRDGAIGFSLTPRGGGGGVIIGGRGGGAGA
eukprot:scaffold41106_cov41-Phaeocystis_antarctica.AAC.2